ncbi:MAG: cytochrome-c peroxidase [Gammaproteobacteria bacterium]|nr:MAG: cytochrome-c peroxidase [Gammaproteobacteria bacterium]
MKLTRLTGLLLSVLCPFAAWAGQPIVPIPRHVEIDMDKARLGQRLFSDRRLSRDQSISCASCHDPVHGGVDHRPVSTGVGGQKGRVNAPTVWNAVFNFRQFWNGRAADLREQAEGPIHNPIEMAMDDRLVNQRLQADAEYRRAFRKIYDHAPNLDDALDAITEFERALYTPDSRFDRWLRGEQTLSQEELEGYRLFKQLGCVSCHNGINVGGNSYQYFGAVIPLRQREQAGDRYQLTQDPFDRARYKVPTLRNIELTAPYFHDGSAATLNEAVQLMAYHNLGFDLSNAEVEKIVAFLRTLTGKPPAILEPNE